MSLLVGVGRQGYVNLNGIPLRFDPGTYRVFEAPRFGDKISIGSLKYADFTPHESAHSISSLHGGYGLRRYSDLEQNPNALLMYLESSGVDASNPGVVVLAPEQVTTTLPWSIPPDPVDTQGPVVWFGEFTPAGGANTWVAVAGNIVWTYTFPAGPWVRQLVLPFVPVQGAVGVFGRRLVLGYGAAGVAQVTANLVALANVTDTTPTNLFVFAFTADQAAAYIAGGPAATNVNLVYSSADGIIYTAPAVCGAQDSAITALAPGGGVALCFVGKETELGAIDLAGIYRVLVPFDSKLASNNVGMRWWLGAGGAEQRGPVILVFPRERGLWAYFPSGEFAGTAENISPWAREGLRPLNVRGRVTAVQGSARWLFYAVQNVAGDTWIVKRDSRTGAPHTHLDLGAVNCRALGITSLAGVTLSPRLFLSNGNASTKHILLPVDGESPLDDSLARFDTGASRTITLSDIDLGFPDEDKIFFLVRVIADGLTAARTINVAASVDGAATYTSIGTANTSPSQEIDFATNTRGKRVSIRLTFLTNVNTATPQLRGVVVRASLVPRLYRMWEFACPLPAGSQATFAEDTRIPYSDLATLWTARSNGNPVSFVDRWGDTWQVRILQVEEKEVVREPDRTPDSLLQVVLLEVVSGLGTNIYGDALAIYGDAGTLYG